MSTLCRLVRLLSDRVGKDSSQPELCRICVSGLGRIAVMIRLDFDGVYSPVKYGKYY